MGHAIGMGEAGIDQHEVRRWDGWYRHVTRAIGAEKGGAPLTADLVPPTVPEVRWLLCRLVWGRPPPPNHTLSWSLRRRRHQVRAKHSQDQRHQARLREQLRLRY
jgi:hypothetical protein